MPAAYRRMRMSARPIGPKSCGVPGVFRGAAPAWEGTAAKVERLVPPPRLVPAGNTLHHISCGRPVRSLGVEIRTQALQNKRVALIIGGHGGSGWTLLPGTIAKAMEQFASQKIASGSPVTVIGAGCMGLMMAINLQDMGYKVQIVAEKEVGICSDSAAGYYALVSLQGPKGEFLQEIETLSFLGYRDINEGRHPFIPRQCVRYMPVYCGKETESGLEGLVERGYLPKPEPVTLDFGNESKHEDFLKWMTYFLDTTKMMQALKAECAKRGIEVRQRKIASFGEIKEGTIICCAGFGNGALTNDPSYQEVVGDLVTLKPECAGTHMDYMVYTRYQEGCVYMFPRTVTITSARLEGEPCAAMFGGSFLSREEHNRLSDHHAKIADLCNRFFHGS